MQEINVKMGEIELTNKTAITLAASSLGSCIGLGVFDRKSRMAGMAHIVLPDSKIGYNRHNNEEQPGKYADTAVPALIGKMLSLGSKKEDLVIKIAGGAQMFNLQGDSNVMNIGARNAEAVLNALATLGLRPIKSDTGGNKGRTLKLKVMDGSFSLKIIGQQEVEF